MPEDRDFPTMSNAEFGSNWDAQRPSFRSPISTGVESRPAHFERGAGGGGSRFETINSKIKQLSNDIYRLGNTPQEVGEKVRLQGSVDIYKAQRMTLYERADSVRATNRIGYVDEMEEVLETNLQMVLSGDIEWAAFDDRMRADAIALEIRNSGETFTDPNTGAEVRYEDEFGGLAKAALDGAVKEIHYRRFLQRADIPQSVKDTKARDVAINSFMPFGRAQDELEDVLEKEAAERAGRGIPVAPAAAPIPDAGFDDPTDVRPPQRVVIEGGITADAEKKRWIEEEYSREFWDRFKPNSEPRFYQEITQKKERDFWSARWQLARAAFHKDFNHSDPSQYTENKDAYLSNEQLQSLYEYEIKRGLEGVRAMMEGYAQYTVKMAPEIDNKTGRPRFDTQGRIKWKMDTVNGEIQKILIVKRDDDGSIKSREMSIYECTEYDFEDFRTALRMERLGLLEDQLGLFSGRPLSEKEVRFLGGKTLPESDIRDLIGQTLSIDEVRGLAGSELTETDQLGLDAMAWGQWWVYNGLEGSDSRYSHGGRRHENLPLGIMVSDEIRAVLHPQEKWESKNESKHHWGAFGLWGEKQIVRIRKSVGWDNIKDDKHTKWEKVTVWEPAPKKDYWSYRTKREDVKDEDGHDKMEDGKRVRRFTVTIGSPEVYPLTVTESLFDETSAGSKTLMEYLAAGEKIPWREVRSGAAASYITGKVGKALKFNEYWAPEKPIDRRTPGWGIAWGSGLSELFTRLKPEKELEELKKEGIRTYQTAHNLRVLPVWAAHGGVKFPENPDPELNLPGLDRKTFQDILRDPSIAYLRGGLIGGETFDLD